MYNNTFFLHFSVNVYGTVCSIQCIDRHMFSLSLLKHFTGTNPESHVVFCMEFNNSINCH